LVVSFVLVLLPVSNTLTFRQHWRVRYWMVFVHRHRVATQMAPRFIRGNPLFDGGVPDFSLAN
jgi:hypothetical protein